MILFLMLKVMFTTTEENKVILAECQQSFEYLTTRHCSLVNINTILCADILKSLRKKSQKQKKKNMWQYQQSVETHCPKGSPYNVKTKQKFEHFPCYIVPLFKLPVKKKLTLKLWLGERGEGCGLFCSLWSYPIWGHALNNFVADWRNDH